MRIPTFRKRTISTSVVATNIAGSSLALSFAAESAVAQSRFEELVHRPFRANRPTAETALTRLDDLHFQRGRQTYLWAMPLINTRGKDGWEKLVGAGHNVLPISKERLDAESLVITPNSDATYAMGDGDPRKDGLL